MGSHATHDTGHIAITGASAGIGAGIAKAFGGAGQKLTLVARRRGPMEDLAAALKASGADAQVIESDMNELDTCCAWVAEAEAKFGPIDVLVLNAGIQIVQSALSVTNEQAEAEMRINVLAPQRLTRLVAPAMVARGHGTIIIVSSMAGITSTPGMADYSASKSAVAAYFETLRVELEGTGVNVVTVYPGPVATDMEKAAREKIPETFLTKRIPMGTSDELGDLVRKVVRERGPRIVYPKVYGVTRFMRWSAQWATNRFAPKVK